MQRINILWKNSVIKGGSGYYLKSGTFFLNILAFPFTIKKRAVNVSKTSGSLKYFVLTTYSGALQIYFHFTLLHNLSLTTPYFMYDAMAVSQICRKWNLLFPFNSIFTALGCMFLKPLARTMLFRLIKVNKSVYIASRTYRFCWQYAIMLVWKTWSSVNSVKLY